MEALAALAREVLRGFKDKEFWGESRRDEELVQHHLRRLTPAMTLDASEEYNPKIGLATIHGRLPMISAKTENGRELLTKLDAEVCRLVPDLPFISNRRVVHAA